MRRCRRSWGENAGTPAAVQARDCRTEAIAAEPLEHEPLGRPVFAGHEREDGLKDGRGHVHPAPVAGLRDRLRDSPAAASLVDVAPRKLLELAQPHTGRVEDDERQPVTARQQGVDGEDVLRRRRRDLRALLTRKPDVDAIARRVRNHARVVEDHRHGVDDLANRLALGAFRIEPGNEARDVLGGDRVDPAPAEHGQRLADRRPVLQPRALGRRVTPATAARPRRTAAPALARQAASCQERGGRRVRRRSSRGGSSPPASS